jgi:hypothetical protein
MLLSLVDPDCIPRNSLFRSPSPDSDIYVSLDLLVYLVYSILL